MMKDPAEQSYGKRLQEARLGAGLSTDSVAESLRLDPKFVVALEQEDVESLPAPTYTRGYIRAYAQLVRCNADQLIAQYNVHAGTDPELTDITARAVEKPGAGGGPATYWVTFAVVGGLIALLLLWVYDSLRPLNLWAGSPFEQEPAAQTQPYASPAAAEDMEISGSGFPESTDLSGLPVDDPVGEPRQSDLADNMLSDIDENLEVEPDARAGEEVPADPVVEINEEVTFAGETATAVSEGASEVVSGAPRGSDVLRLNFRGQSWVEVVDANGFQLAYGMFETRTLNLEGQAPFRVMLGDATQVDVIINGDGVALKPYIRWNKTANLSVGKAATTPD